MPKKLNQKEMEAVQMSPIKFHRLLAEDGMGSLSTKENLKSSNKLLIKRKTITQKL